MRIINIIETATDTAINGGIIGIESFGVYEEQLSEDVVQEAENLFRQKAIENGANEDDLDDAIEDGYYTNGSYTISIVWSYLN
jgi:hypothetical protein